jgi:hypothetical protein
VQRGLVGTYLPQPDVIFLTLILIAPGLISQGVFNHFVERGKAHALDVYQGILHSFYICLFIYPFIFLAFPNVAAFTRWLTDFRWGRPEVALSMLTVSLIWGWLRALLYKNEGLEKFLMKLGCSAVEPPNLYAAILDTKYWDEQHGPPVTPWITARIGKEIVVGSVEKYALTREPREIYIKNVVYYSADSSRYRELPPDTGAILRVDDLELLEINMAGGIKTAAASQHNSGWCRECASKRKTVPGRIKRDI